MLVRVRLGGWAALMASVGIKRYGTDMLCSSGLWYAACGIVRFGILSSMVQGVTVYGVLGRSLAITRHHPH